MSWTSFTYLISLICDSNLTMSIYSGVASIKIFMISFNTGKEKEIAIRVNIIEIKGSNIFHSGLKNNMADIMTTPIDCTMSPII